MVLQGYMERFKVLDQGCRAVRSKAVWRQRKFAFLSALPVSFTTANREYNSSRGEVDEAEHLPFLVRLELLVASQVVTCKCHEIHRIETVNAIEDSLVTQNA